jgi:hypothetical protein
VGVARGEKETIAWGVAVRVANTTKLASGKNERFESTAKLETLLSVSRNPDVSSLNIFTE